MSALTSPRTYAALAAFEVFDMAACAVPARYVVETLERLGWPANLRWVLVVLKAGAALGLLSVFRFPGLARFTGAVMTLYFGLATAAHVRVRDTMVNTAPAALFLVIYAAVTSQGRTS